MKPNYLYKIKLIRNWVNQTKLIIGKLRATKVDLGSCCSYPGIVAQRVPGMIRPTGC